MSRTTASEERPSGGALPRPGRTRRNVANVEGGLCRNGHLLEGRNIFVQKRVGRNDTIRCRLCVYNKQRGYIGLGELTELPHQRNAPTCSKGHPRQEGRPNDRGCEVCRRDKDREQKYGLTVETFDALVERQSGCCAICRILFTDIDARHLHVDHNHKTGAVRGLLCHGCNTAIGLFNDDPERLEAALRYLS